jgi:hypothetical protein
MSLRIGSSPRPAAPISVHAPATVTAKELKFANDFVKKNAGGDHGRPGRGKLFPDINAGESGLMGSVLTGKAAEGLLVLNKEAGSDIARRSKYDPKKELLVAVVTTDYSEPIVYTAAVDRKTGKGRLMGELELTTVASDVPESTFNKYFKKAGSFESTDLAAVIALAGKKLDLPGKPG